MTEHYWFTHTYKTDFGIIDFQDVKFDFYLRLWDNRKNWFVTIKIKDSSIDVLQGEFNEDVTDETFFEFFNHLTSGEDVKEHFIKYVNDIYKQSELQKLLGMATKYGSQ